MQQNSIWKLLLIFGLISLFFGLVSLQSFINSNNPTGYLNDIQRPTIRKIQSYS